MLIITTDDTSEIIHRFGADCPPDQQYRELTQNGIDSIARFGRPGEVLWTHDVVNGVRKICVIDSGCGMSPEEVLRYINRLGSSGGTISDTKNFGIGAKISAGVRNPAGLEYHTWKDGIGYRFLFHCQDNNYGLFQFRKDVNPGDPSAYYELLPESARPKEISGHGTKVILHGNGPDHDTWAESRVVLGTRVDGDADHTGQWLIKYLNSRYLVIPDGVVLNVREQRTAQEVPTKSRIQGEKSFLLKNCEDSGSSVFQDVTIHWFVFPQKSGGGGEKYTSSPFMATVFQNELYDQKVGASAQAALRNAGVFMNMGRVVLVFEPSSSSTIHPNNVRTSLNLDGHGLPYAQWEEEFSKNLPDPILRLLADLKVQDKSKEADERIRDIVSRMAPKRVTTRRGTAKAGDPDQEQANVGQGDGSGSDPGVRPPRETGNPPAGSNPTRPEGDISKASHIKKFPIPDIVWVSANPPSGWNWVEKREPGEMEDEAGCYVPSIRKIKMNADFKPIMTFVDDLKKEYKSTRAPDSYIANEIHRWIGTKVKEMVAHVLAWQGSSKSWADVSSRLTEAHITAAALSFREAETECRKAIHSRFRPKGKTGKRGKYKGRPSTVPDPTYVQ